MKLLQKYKEVFSKLGWLFNEVDGHVEIENYSPAGEDLVECLDLSDLAHSAWELYDGFDVNEHVYEWLRAKYSEVPPRSDIPDVWTLVNDGDAIAKMYENLFVALSHAERGVAL